MWRNGQYCRLAATADALWHHARIESGASRPLACLRQWKNTSQRFGWRRQDLSSFKLARTALLAFVLVVTQQPLRVLAQDSASSPNRVRRQAPDDAWWTGPIMTNGAGTLPRGHFLIEPYVYDVSVARVNLFGSRAYVLYGLADRLTVGVVPVVGFNKVRGGLSSSGVGLGDASLVGQYRLTLFHAGSWVPTASVEVQETFPTGAYDRLGDRPSNGLGSGAYTTTLSVNSQTFFWLPNGRLLRMRLNVFQAMSRAVKVEDVSVYGTAAGFRGYARPGSSFYAYASWEYSMTRRWVLALDATYTHDRDTRVSGYSILDSTSVQPPPGIRLDLGASDAFAFAPAVEYSWTPNVGVIVGTRLVPASRNTTASVTPVAAINIVY
jgi:hypothetical protein